MNKTLEELGEEYLREIDAINEKIDIYRKRLKKAMKDHNCDEIFITRKLLHVFYEQRYEMTDNARQLINYYS